MRFFTASSLLAMVTAAIAQTPGFNPVYTPTEFEEVPAGSTYEITWSAPAEYRDGTISISLIGGATQNTLVPLGEIATGVPNSAETYSWAVDSALGNDPLYGLVVRYESSPDVFQYSMPFHIKAGSNDDGEGEGEGEDENEGEDDGESEGEHVPVVTKTTGIMTVTLSSCPPTETSTTAYLTTSVAHNTTSTWVTMTSTYNSSSSVVVPTVTSTYVLPSLPPAPTVEVPEVTTPAPVPSAIPSDVPVGAAGRFTAGPLALVGGAVVAALLL